MDHNELQDINEQFERTGQRIIGHHKFLERRTYITFLLAAEETSLSDKWVFTV